MGKIYDELKKYFDTTDPELLAKEYEEMREKYGIKDDDDTTACDKVVDWFLFEHRNDNLSEDKHEIGDAVRYGWNTAKNHYLAEILDWLRAKTTIDSEVIYDKDTDKYMHGIEAFRTFIGRL